MVREAVTVVFGVYYGRDRRLFTVLAPRRFLLPMPSLEIVCLDQTRPSDFACIPFAVESETELVSHRGPSSLFQHDFARVNGCMYHIGNPEMKDPKWAGAYIANDLLDEYWDGLRFTASYRPQVQELRAALVASSPARRILFTTDYQFGPMRRRYTRWRTLEEFRRLHDAGQLRANALCALCGG